MNVEKLWGAIDRVRKHTPPDNSRPATYLRTYPALLAAASCEGVDDKTKFLQLAMMTYGWMPRVLRLDAKHLNKATEVFYLARVTSQDLPNIEILNHISGCLRSVVGASKLLHFVIPEEYPIWDSNVERFRCGTAPSPYHMGKADNYASYVREVHGIRREPTFQGFYEKFNQAYQERLGRLQIPSYPLTPIRVIEAAAFELAGDEDT